MQDEAHKQTDVLLYRLERSLSILYADTARKIRKATAPLLENIYLDDDSASKTKRLNHANKNGKDDVVKKTTKIIVNANEQAVSLINRRQMEIYKLNFAYAVNDIIRQVRDSMAEGGD